MFKFKNIFLLLVVLFCSSVLFASEYDIKKNNDGTCVITKYNGNARFLEILATINGYKVISIGNATFWGCESLESITIPESVTSIGNAVFWGCESLESITIPESVTSIGDAAFWNCESLESINVDEDNLTYAQIQGVLFNKTEKSIHSYPAGKKNTTYFIPDGIVHIGDSAFSDCSSLKSITIPMSVTSIGDEAFYYCESLESITIPKSVTSIGKGIFKGCKSLENIKVDENNPVYSQVQGVLFNKTKNIIHSYPAGKKDSTYSIPDGIVHIGDSAFSDCDSLESITIPMSVTSIGDGAFSYCDSLESINIPEGVTYIGDWAFDGCSSLESITIPMSVTSIGDGAFSYCDNLIEIKAQEGSYAYKYLLNSEYSHLLDYVPSWL